MRFGVLGTVAVWTSSGTSVAVPGLKVRALLADLIMHEGRPVPAERLIADIWGERAPGNPLGAFQAKVSQLRRALGTGEPGGRDLIESGDAGYLLRAAPDAVDAGRFATLLVRSRAQREPARRVALLTEALALWRGAAYADFADEPFARPAVERLEQQRLAALEDLAEARLALGEHTLVAGELADLVTANPWRERLRAAHLRALYGSGRQREALAAYERFRRRLRDELGLDPSPELGALHQAILRRDAGLAPPIPPPAVARTNLPAPASPRSQGGLIGRDDAIDVVRERLAVERLVTLTGPGGVGKTRLAIEAARALTDRFPDGVWLVELAGRPARADPEALGEIAEQVATALGIREDTVAGLPDDHWPDPTDRLVAALHERCTLLVLDNCDHLLTPVAHLAARLLDAAAQVRVLTTSREPLGAAGEVTLPVPPLAVPAADATTEQIAQAAAVRLFVSRAHAAEPGFALGADTAETVATVCRRLDGIPLALELAANRLRALDVAELAARLDDRFRLLSSGKRTAPARQQTLRAMIDYSWEPLTAAERSVLSRLATFADGATLAAAEQVCSGGRVAPGDVLDVLARLVDRSLVTVRDGESPRRYRLLETVAAFGLERLEEAGETDATRRRHAAFFARLAEDTALRLRGHDQHRALAELEAEPANLRAALDDAAARGWSLLCLRLATSLAWYRLVWGRFREAGRDLRTALDTVAACDDDRAPDTLRRHAETWLTAVAPHGSDPAAARRQVLERYGNARDTDAAGRAFAQWLFAFTMLHSGDATEAAQLVGAALATFRDVGDRWGVAAALSTRADLALVQGDLVRAQHDSEASRSLFTQLGDRRGHVHPTGVLGAVAEIRGDYATAAARYREALRIAEELKLWASVSKQLACLGRLALLAGDHADAVAYHERALRVAEEQSNRPAAAFASTGLAMIARRSGDLDAAEARMRDLLDWNRHTGYQPGAAFALAELGFVAEQRGDAATAERRHRASLEAARATGDDRAVALAIEGLAGSAGLTGGHRRAARLLGVAAALRETAGAPLPSDEGHDVHRIAARTREALGDADFVAELRRGGRLDLADPAVLGDGQRDVSAP